MEDIRDKIKDAYENIYCSHHSVSEEEIDLIIKHECKCDDCEKSIFDLYDFPEININKDFLLCENCHIEYEMYCDICEETHYSYEVYKVGENRLSYMYYIGARSKPGVYKAISYPMYITRVGGFGGTNICWNNLKFICDIESFIEANKSKELKEKLMSFQEDDWNEYAEYLCPNCKISKQQNNESK